MTAVENQILGLAGLAEFIYNLPATFSLTDDRQGFFQIDSDYQHGKGVRWEDRSFNHGGFLYEEEPSVAAVRIHRAGSPGVREFYVTPQDLVALIKPSQINARRKEVQCIESAGLWAEATDSLGHCVAGLRWAVELAMSPDSAPE